MWWQIPVGVVAAAVMIYGLWLIAGVQTRWLSRRTDRTAESMYASNADLTRRQRRSAARNHDPQRRG